MRILQNSEKIFPYFQPIVSVATGQIMGHEVLARIQTSSGVQSLGPFFEDENISYKEKLEVDRIVREKAFAVYHEQKRSDMLFINIHPSWLFMSRENHRHYFTFELMDKYCIKGSQIVIEILEAEYNASVENMSQLVSLYREKDCRIAVDDFNFHNFDRLIQLVPDFVKIDIRLVQLSSKHEEYQKILHYISQFSIDLGISVLFEGIEQGDELENALETGASFLQGFIFSPAQPDFSSKETFKNLISSSIVNVVDRKSNRYRNFLHIENEMNRMIQSLIQKSSQNEDTEEGGALSFASEDFAWDDFLRQISDHLPSWFFKAYVCDKDGHQISANIARDASNKFCIYEQYRGMNWSWRPYFIHNVIRMEQLQRGVISNKYVDMENKRDTVTFSFPMNDDYYLFLDFYYEAK